MRFRMYTLDVRTSAWVSWWMCTIAIFCVAVINGQLFPTILGFAAGYFLKAGLVLDEKYKKSSN